MTWMQWLHDVMSVCGFGLIGVWLAFEARASMKERNKEIERSWEGRKDEEDNN